MDGFNYNGTPIPQGYQQMYYQNGGQPQYNQRNWQQYYQPQVQQPSPTPQYQQPTQANGNIFWVLGEAGAKSYTNLQPGVPIALWDSEDQVIYIKSIDQTGKPQMTKLRYKEETDEDKKVVASDEYAKKDQIDNLASQLSEVSKKFENLGNFVTIDQFDTLNDHINDLGNQIENIENRITSFGKPQQSNSSSKRGNKQ